MGNGTSYVITSVVTFAIGVGGARSAQRNQRKEEGEVGEQHLVSLLSAIDHLEGGSYYTVALK